MTVQLTAKFCFSLCLGFCNTACSIVKIPVSALCLRLLHAASRLATVSSLNFICSPELRRLRA